MKLLDCIASIVVYKNPRKMVRNAAESFLDTNLAVKLYIVDNSPTPAIESTLYGLSLQYIFNNANIGFGRAHNIAIEQAEASKYFLILNPDIVISHNAIEELHNFMELNPDVGMVCPKVLNEDGSVQHLNKRHPTIYDLFLRRFLPKKLRPFFQKRLDYYEMKDMGYDSVYDVPFVSGAFMFCRTHTLKEVGGFDPRFFMYFEDADLSRKFQVHGYRTVYYPFVNITHLWERASHKSAKMALVFIVNGIRYFNKGGWKLF